MNLKRIILCLAICTYIIGNVNFAQELQKDYLLEMVSNYKAQNYTACLQIAEKITKEDPTNIYAHYYQGLAYTQLGKKNEALDAYKNVISLNSNKTIVEYAQKGSSCLESKDGCKEESENNNSVENFIKSNKFYSNSVQAEINKQKLDRIKTNINKEVNGTKKKSEAPTNDEIAEAVKTLAKAGINPMAGFNNAMYTNPEMMQMNMLLGNDNQNNNNNMLPYLMMMHNQQNGTQNNMSPELIQTMMMSQMQMY